MSFISLFLARRSGTEVEIETINLLYLYFIHSSDTGAFRYQTNKNESSGRFIDQNHMQTMQTRLLTIYFDFSFFFAWNAGGFRSLVFAHSYTLQVPTQCVVAPRRWMYGNDGERVWMCAAVTVAGCSNKIMTVFRCVIVTNWYYCWTSRWKESIRWQKYFPELKCLIFFFFLDLKCKNTRILRGNVSRISWSCMYR